MKKIDGLGNSHKLLCNEFKNQLPNLTEFYESGQL